jgi:hypothetical protein
MNRFLKNGASMKVICGSLTLVSSLVLINLAQAQQGREQPKKEQPVKQKVYEVGKGLSIDSKLDEKDTKDPEKECLAKIFLVKLVKGKTYQIDMSSTVDGFDSWLRLEGASKKQLAEDDDSGGNLNARIIFMAPADAVYRIITTTYASKTETGPFNLRIQEK